MVLSSQLASILIFLLTAWLTIISLVLIKAFSVYKQLTSGINKNDFASVLTQIKKQLSSLDKNLTTQQTNLDQIHKSLKSHIQKIGFIRYNPFGNTGGSHSFCFCLLDEEDNGILITSLHARDQTRIYTKEIRAGASKDNSPLSKEEAQSIKQAKSWSKSK